MSVTRTTETFVNKCISCRNTWRAVVEVDIIDWYDDTSSLVESREIECHKCGRLGLVNKISDKP